MTFKKVFVTLVFVLFLVAVSVHATVQHLANQYADEMVTELIELLENSGISISIGRLTVQPYRREVTARNVVIEMGEQPYSIGLVRLSQIEFNEAEDFILAMRVDVEQSMVSVTPQLADAIHPEVIWQTLQHMGIEDGQIAQRQSVDYRYIPELSRVQITANSRVHHPDNIRQAMYEFEVTTEFSQLPDLQQMFDDFRRAPEQSNLSMRWLSTGLIAFSADYIDSGWWSAYRSTAARISGLTEQHFNYASAEQVTAWIAELTFLPASTKQLLTQVSADFITAETPRLHFSVRALPSDGVNIPMAFMAALMSPNTLENFFKVDLSVDSRENE